MRRHAFLAFLILPPAEIIRRADRSDSEYLKLGERHPAVVSLGRAGDGTLIAPRWILTAAHVAQAVASRRPENRLVRIGATDYQVALVALHPEWTEMGPHDIALIRLTRAVKAVRPVGIYRRHDEAGRIAVLVGHGKGGVGSDRNRVEDGLRRGATSRVDSADAVSLYFSFDPPPEGTRLEGAPGPGDSGGPALLEMRGRTYVAGVSSAGYDGRNGPGTYGAIDVFTRVSMHARWVDSVMVNRRGP